jgi:3-keto-5-aminohexanoate cleavage enzyme
MTSEAFAISLCPTGMVPKREDSPHVPLSAEEISEQVLECAHIGVTSVHLHARDGDGEPMWQKEYFAEIISRIRAERSDIVVCVTTSGRSVSEVEKRAEVLSLDGDLTPDMASLTLSSMNFARSASINAPDTVQYLARTMIERGIVPELEIFDLGMTNYVMYLIDKGILRPPFVANLLLGGPATAQARPLDLGLLVERLPKGTYWSVGGIGTHQLTANLLGLASGGGVRVGLEDNLHWDSARKRLATNRQLVKRIVSLGELMGKTVMEPAAFRKDVLGCHKTS